MILSVSLLCLVAGASRSLFGFEGQQLVGQPLSSAIDIFTDWKQGHGEELSLLELLVGQLMASDPSATRVTSVCASWRVGVHKPVAPAHADAAVRMQQLFGKLFSKRRCRPVELRLTNGPHRWYKAFGVTF